MNSIYILLLAFLTGAITAEHNSLISDEYFVLAQNLEREGHKDRAVEYYKKAIGLQSHHFNIVCNLDPDHERAPLHLGSAQEKLGNVEDAIALYKKLIEKDSSSLEAYRHLGNAYRNIERLEDALEPFLKAAELQPRNIHVLMDLANVYNMLDRCPEALEYYQKI